MLVFRKKMDISYRFGVTPYRVYAVEAIGVDEILGACRTTKGRESRRELRGTPAGMK